MSVVTCNTWTSIRPKAFLSLYGMANTSSEWYTVAKAPGTMVAGFVSLDSLNSADYNHYFQAGNKAVSEDYSNFQDLTGRLGLFFWALREGMSPISHSNPKIQTAEGRTDVCANNR